MVGFRIEHIFLNKISRLSKKYFFSPKNLAKNSGPFQYYNQFWLENAQNLDIAVGSEEDPS